MDFNLLSFDDTSIPSRGCVLAKLIRSPNDKWRTICDKLNDEDEYGCTSWIWMWLSEKLLPGATWKLPPICNHTNKHILSDYVRPTKYVRNDIFVVNICIFIETYSIDFNVSIDLTTFIQCQFFRFILLIYIIFTFALFEFFGFRIPSFLAIRFNYILTSVTTMCIVCSSSIAIATNRLISWCRGCRWLNLIINIITNNSNISCDRLWLFIEKIVNGHTLSSFFVDVAISSFLASSIGLPCKSTRLL